MSDPFLSVTRVTTETSAMSNAIQAALQHNKTYKEFCGEREKQFFRSELARQLRAEAGCYAKVMSDFDHFKTIRTMSNGISQLCGKLLVNDRFRYGTAQKALNLYLKFLWKLGMIETPPHCPIDRVVLEEAGIRGFWTRSDSEAEYRGWIKACRIKAGRLGLAEWEDQVWLRNTGYLTTLRAVQ